MLNPYESYAANPFPDEIEETDAQTEAREAHESAVEALSAFENSDACETDTGDTWDKLYEAVQRTRKEMKSSLEPDWD